VSNLSDLLPAGAAAKQLTFTDSGSGIASKAPVVLNSDGTVTAVTGATGSVGSSTQMNTHYYIANSNGRNAVYDTSNDKVVVFYTDLNGTPSRLGYAVVGTVSSGSISFGTPVVVASAVGMWDFGVAFDSTANKVIITYRDATNTEFRSQVGTVSGTSISFGSAQQIGSINYSSEVDCIYDATADRVVTMVTDSGNGAVFVGQVSGTSITWGSAQALSGADGRPRLVYDPDEGKTICVYRTASSDHYLTGAVATISSSTATFGTPVTGISSAMDYLAVAYDTGSDKIVAGGTLTSGGHTVALVGNVSGTSITWGSYDFAYIGTSYYTSISYDVTANKTIITFTDGSFHAKYNVATVSGTTISFPGSGAVALVSVSNTFYGYTLYDPDTQQNILTYGDSTNSNYGESLVYTITYNNLTAQAFVGVADSAISASAAGSVIVQGGTVTGVNAGQGFTVGTPAAFGGGVGVGYAAMAYDTVHDKMVIAYQDQNNGNYGTAVVATISGSSISYGTQVVFESGGTEWIDVCFDPDQERVIIAYRDSPNSDYGTVIVGEVSGTSITFGSPVVYSTATTQNVNCVYDTSNDKVVIVYYDVSNTQLNAVVGTVSGSSISLGTPTTIVANATWPGVKAVFDSTSNKVVVVYANQTNGDSDGVVGTVSGTSISFGSIVQFESGLASPLTAAYDASADKTLVVYGDAGNSDYATSVVATVSGTSITFTSPSVFQTFQPGVVKSVYDATAQQTVIAYQDYSASYIGVAQAVSISGTTATFSGKTTLVNANPSPFNLGYDSDNGKTIFAFVETTGQALVTSYGDLPLTTGTKYYVTTSGTFSSSADTPSVNAGLAISTTSLLLNGDS